jgi:hypothetical protein
MERLPVESLAQVARFLTFEEILACSAVATRVLQMCREDAVWEGIMKREEFVSPNDLIVPDAILAAGTRLMVFCILKRAVLKRAARRHPQEIVTEMLPYTAIEPLPWALPGIGSLARSRKIHGVSKVSFSGIPGGSRAVVARRPLLAPLSNVTHSALGWGFPMSFPVGVSRTAADLVGHARTSKPTEAITLHQFGISCVSYFEVCIRALPSNAPAPESRPAQGVEGAVPCVAIGLATKKFGLAAYMPGWDVHSYGYHGDDGKKFHAGGVGDRYSAAFGAGDTVGCGLAFVPSVMSSLPAAYSEPSACFIFFTKNSCYLGPAFDGIDPTLEWHPCVGIDAPCLVDFNFGSRPFEFDIRTMAIQTGHSNAALLLRATDALMTDREVPVALQDIKLAPPPPYQVGLEKPGQPTAADASSPIELPVGHSVIQAGIRLCIGSSLDALARASMSQAAPYPMRKPVHPDDSVECTHERADQRLPPQAVESDFYSDESEGDSEPWSLAPLIWNEPVSSGSEDG